MPHFLVPCSCGQKLPVTTAQAGQRLACSCGRSIDVPTLRELQSLERVESRSAAPPQRRWGARQGLVFLGTTIAVVALVAAIWLEVTRPKALIIVERLSPASHPTPTVRDSIEPAVGFQTLTPADVWLTWAITTPVGADPRFSMYGAIADRSETRWTGNWRDWRYLDWIFGALGVGLLAFGLLLPQRRVRRTTKTRAGAAP